VSADAPDRSREQPAARASANFPRAARLLKHSDFERVYKQGKRHFSSHITVFYLRQPEGASPRSALPQTVFQAKLARIGFTVGRVLGGAVERNRIKRRMREVLRRHVDLLPEGCDLIFHPRRFILTVEFAKLEAEVVRILHQANVEAKRMTVVSFAQKTPTTVPFV